MKFKLSLFSLFFFSYLSFSQSFQLSPNAEISVLTIGSGNYLNDAFGHNTFRVKDRARGLDVSFDYGGYDFDAPNFYLKFARGKLNYLTGKNRFKDIYTFYTEEDRTITEQKLNLTQTQKQRLYNYLINDYKPENRRYLYDFFYDNCATKIRDVVEIAIQSDITYSSLINTEPKTFRQLIHEHVGINTWGSFGIDIALGSLVDRQATAREYMFLPKYISKSFSNAKISEAPLVKSTNIIHQSKNNTGYNKPLLVSPLVILTLIGLFIIYLTRKDEKRQTRSRWLDSLLFGITGTIGVFLLLLWFATDHSTTGYNYNLLWAFPLNLVLMLQLFSSKQKKWVNSFLKFLMILLGLMTLHWFMGVQSFALTLIPFLIALLYRYYFLLKFLSKA